jgi:SAM-dependent methyltransferase
VPYLLFYTTSQEQVCVTQERHLWTLANLLIMAEQRRNRHYHRKTFVVIAALTTVCWMTFAAGCWWQHAESAVLNSWTTVLVVLFPAIAIAFTSILWLSSWRLRDRITDTLRKHTDALDSMPATLLWLWIALAACLSLYAELMVIRLHSSFFQLFAYFKNVSLLSCFLGLGIGYARGARSPVAVPLVMPALGVQIVFLYLLRLTPVATGLQNPISEQLTLGLFQASGLAHILTVYGLLGLIFVYNALCFVVIGQLASRLMMRTGKLIAYSWNLLGSLAGIVVLAGISFLWMPPSVWVALAAVMVLVFLRRPVKHLWPSIAATIVTVAVISIPPGHHLRDVYSPYQILTLNQPEKQPPELKASNTYHQRILDLRMERLRTDPQLQKWARYYNLPYLFQPHLQDVLIVGSGTGNDVAAALRFGAQRVDAVEIDPTILDFGRKLHPESPYQSDKVTAIVDDARAYLRHTNRRYDLIVYGLLDSHTLLSGKSGGVRLDSYVYTVEAFREARRHLKENGIMCLTFCIMKPVLGRKLFIMLTEAFDGTKPVVFSVGYDGGYTFLSGDNVDQSTFYSPPGINNITTFLTSGLGDTDVSTDDWPFFYMPKRTYPVTYLIVIAVLFVLSSTLIWQLAPGAGGGFSVPCFFLGAGFMLIETKGITELALLYGSTWVVMSVVIGAILVMAFLATLLVIKIGSPHPGVTYGLLCAAILAGASLAYVDATSMTPWQQKILMTSLLTLPLFFSGFAFSSELKKSKSVAVALSSNLLGAMLGGLMEYNSMYFGFHALYFLALGMYLLAFAGSIRAART